MKHEDCDCQPLPPALWMILYGLWDATDVSTRTDDVTDDEVASVI